MAYKKYLDKLKATLRHYEQNFQYLLPFQRTRQDEAMWNAIKLARSPLSHRKLVILTEFRGSRKTWVARRCSLRSSLKLFWTIEHIPAGNMSDEQLLQQIQSPAIPVYLYKTALSLLVAVLLAFAYRFFSSFSDASKSQQSDGSTIDTTPQPLSQPWWEHIWRELGEIISNELPTAAGFTCGLLFLLMNKKRRRVFLVDDPLGTGHTAFKTHLARNAAGVMWRPLLETIRSKAEITPMVLISSNEGIEKCFADDAPLLHHTIKFPPPSPHDIVRACKELGLYDMQNLPIGVHHVALAATLVPHHHCYSIRWWKLCASSISKDAVAIKRETLEDVCLRLDLKSSEAFRAEALALSAQMPRTSSARLNSHVAFGSNSESDPHPHLTSQLSEREKLAQLTGCNIDLFPDSLPRRLGLAWALVLTTDAGLEALDKLNLETEKNELTRLMNLTKDETEKAFFQSSLRDVESKLVAIDQEETHTAFRRRQDLCSNGPELGKGKHPIVDRPKHTFLANLCDMLEKAGNDVSGVEYLKEVESLLVIVQKAVGKPAKGFLR